MKLQTLKRARWLAVLALMSVSIWLAFWHHLDRGPIVWIGILVAFVLAVIAWVLKLMIQQSKEPWS
jgi:hypothetical protein